MTTEEQLKKTTFQLNEIIAKLSQTHHNITATKETLLQQREAVDKDIDQFFDEKIEHQRQLMKQDLDTEVTSKTKLLTSQLEQVESLQASVTQLASEVHRSHEQSGEKQLVQRVNEVTDTFNKLKTDPTETNAFFFAPAFPDPFPMIGYVHLPRCEVIIIPATVLPGQKVEFSIITKDFWGDPLTVNEKIIKVKVADGKDHVQWLPVRDFEKGGYPGTFSIEEIGHFQLSVLIGEQSVRGGPFPVVVSRDYNKLRKSTKAINDDGRMGKPRGVAFSHNHHWAVTDTTNHCVYIFNEQDQLVRKFGSHGNNKGQFEDPYGLCFDSYDNLYVADVGNNRVQKFNFFGEHYIDLGWQGEGSDRKLSSPHGIAINQNTVYVADSSNCCISVYQANDGAYCFSFGSQGDGPGQFKIPWDVAITPDSTLVVADERGCIQAFHLDGTFIHKFGTPGYAKGQLNFPSSLAVDANGYILVTDYHNDRVLVFDKSYSYVTSFGSKGSGNHHFSVPHGIAVSPNGTVYIGDHENKRITIY
ncbi:tripartite motif-containing protein 2-like [Dysidea avara]|uniref:tripartite motif-containing protein 2-like n=1 Tax=Dysidea avara TaxID=196820 RepID=UPI003320BE27